MSSRTDWCSKTIPAKVKQLYGTEPYEKMQSFVRDSTVQWRYTGGTHFEIRHRRDERPVILTLGSTAAMTIYHAKLRQAIRRWEVWRDGM